MNTRPYSDELTHYGVKGMKWGQNIFGKKDAATKKKERSVKQKTREYRNSRTTDPKTDFLKINRPNSAARSYYRAQRTGNFRTYKRQNALMDRKISGLSKEQIENGRYRVARFRNIAAKSVTGLATVGVSVATLGAAPAALLVTAPITALGMNYITGGHYYQGHSATYGSRRAARELKKK